LKDLILVLEVSKFLSRTKFVYITKNQINR
jgi:hypothetical protein